MDAAAVGWLTIFALVGVRRRERFAPSSMLGVCVCKCHARWRYVGVLCACVRYGAVQDGECSARGGVLRTSGYSVRTLEYGTWGHGGETVGVPCTCLTMGLEGDLEPYIGHSLYQFGVVYIATQVPL
eukprot:XP_001701151.1 predicted protein [Chlamydomonas reinhardtii]